MKKAIIAASALLIGATAFGQSLNEKSNLEFNKYIAKRISYNTSFAKDEVQGVIKVKIDMSSNGIENANVLSGINPQIDAQVLEIIKSTPSKISSKYASEKAVSMVVPVKFVLKSE